MIQFCFRVAGPQRRMNCGGSFFVVFLAEMVPLALALRMTPSRRARGNRITPTRCDTCQVLMRSTTEAYTRLNER